MIEVRGAEEEEFREKNEIRALESCVRREREKNLRIRLIGERVGWRLVRFFRSVSVCEFATKTRPADRLKFWFYNRSEPITEITESIGSDLVGLSVISEIYSPLFI